MDFNKLTQKLQEAVAAAQSLAAGSGQQEIDNLHLLKALLQQHEGLLPRLLQKMNIPVGELLQSTDELLQRKTSISGSGAGTVRLYASPSLIRVLEKAEKEAAQMQDEFVAVEHDPEIRRVIRILSRKTKNNPVLIGEPGVGKTAIVEGLAHRIVRKDVPEGLKDKTIFSLDMSSLVAGAKYWWTMILQRRHSRRGGCGLERHFANRGDSVP